MEDAVNNIYCPPWSPFFGFAGVASAVSSNDVLVPQASKSDVPIVALGLYR